MNEIDEMRNYFERLSHEELVNTAIELQLDAIRLREELDKVQGIIR
jgi:hypothetical protein